MARYSACWMYFIYNTIGLHNYALSLVFFTLVYKLILLPLSIKQMKSTKLMEELSRNYKEFRNAINMTKKAPGRTNEVLSGKEL